MKKVALIFLIFSLASLNVLGQTITKYSSFRTVIEIQDKPEKIVKEKVIILVNEIEKKIDIRFLDDRNPILLEYFEVDEKTEATVYKLYENNSGWARLSFFNNKEGLLLNCIPANTLSLRMTFGPLKKQ